MDPFEALASSDPDAPAPPPARIRPFNPDKDLKLTRYLVGAAVMEPSSQANQVALFKPASLLVWAGLVHLLITRVANGYPAVVHNYLYPHLPKAVNDKATILQTLTDSLILIPLVLAPAIMILAVFEWRHRNLFEMEMRRAIGDEDMRDVEAYYDVRPEPATTASEEGDKKPTTRARAKQEQQVKQQGEGDKAAAGAASQPAQRQGFWVLEYDNRLIGAVGLDGSKPGRPLDSVVDLLIAAAREKKEGRGASTDAAASAKKDDSATTTATESTSTDSTLRPRGANAPSVSVTPPTPVSGAPPSPFTLDPSASLPQGTLHIRRFATSMSFRTAGIEDDLLAFVADYAFAPAPEDGEPGPAPAQQLVVAVLPDVQKSLRKALARNGFELVPRGSELDLAQSGAASGGAGAGKKSWAARLWPVSLEQRTMVLRRATWEARQAKE
ncbi:hypothetical protein JCM3775_001787 [Rhodotorula graminis]